MFDLKLSIAIHPFLDRTGCPFTTPGDVSGNDARTAGSGVSRAGGSVSKPLNYGLEYIRSATGDTLELGTTGFLFAGISSCAFPENHVGKSRKDVPSARVRWIANWFLHVGARIFRQSTVLVYELRRNWDRSTFIGGFEDIEKILSNFPE